MPPRDKSEFDDSGSPASVRFRFPERKFNPVRSMAVRFGIAVGALVFTAILVYVQRDCYQDRGQIGQLTWLDAFYYATVTLSTTGYGDITPICETSRLTDAIIITPMRFLFLIVLVGTTVEVLTQRTREQWRQHRWRTKVDHHTVIVGYGVKGRSAAQALLSAGEAKTSIVVVTPDRDGADEATRDGYVAVQGDARREKTLSDASIERASQVVIATDEDDTTILVTLTARKLNPTAKIVAAVREAENTSLIRQSGATSIIPTAESAGRLMGLSLVSTTAGQIMEDLLDSTHGLEVMERDVHDTELGLAPSDLDVRGEIVLAVIRDGIPHRFDTDAVTALEQGDRLVVIQHDPMRG